MGCACERYPTPPAAAFFLSTSWSIGLREHARKRSPTPPSSVGDFVVPTNSSDTCSFDQPIVRHTVAVVSVCAQHQTGRGRRLTDLAEQRPQAYSLLVMLCLICVWVCDVSVCLRAPLCYRLLIGCSSWQSSLPTVNTLHSFLCPCVWLAAGYCDCHSAMSVICHCMFVFS